MKKYDELVKKLQDKLWAFELENPNNIIKVSEYGVKSAKETLKELKTLILKSNFNNHKEEIKFFKYKKPRIHSELIFHAKLFRIASKQPRSSTKQQVKYFIENINQLQNYINENLDFYHYYRRDENYLDKKYFLRKNAQKTVVIDMYPSFLDEGFSTSHDGKVATFIAYEKLFDFLNKEIANIKSYEVTTELRNKKQLTWSDSKTNLVELIYALHTAKIINNGNIEIKDLALIAEKLFNIDLGNYYHTFIEIKARKTNQTKFLDHLKERLIKRIQDSDQ